MWQQRFEYTIGTWRYPKYHTMIRTSSELVLLGVEHLPPCILTPSLLWRTTSIILPSLTSWSYLSLLLHSSPRGVQSNRISFKNPAFSLLPKGLHHDCFISGLPPRLSRLELALNNTWRVEHLRGLREGMKQLMLRGLARDFSSDFASLPRSLTVLSLGTPDHLKC